MSYTLQEVPTKILLRVIQEHNRHVHGEPWNVSTKMSGGWQKRISFHSRPGPGGAGCFDHAIATMEEAVAELNTRPHIPSRREGALIRRLQKENPGWTVEQLRAHSRFGKMIADAQFPNRRVIPPQHAEYFRKMYGSSFGKFFKVQS